MLHNLVSVKQHAQCHIAWLHQSVSMYVIMCSLHQYLNSLGMHISMLVGSHVCTHTHRNYMKTYCRRIKVGIIIIVVRSSVCIHVGSRLKRVSENTDDPKQPTWADPTDYNSKDDTPDTFTAVTVYANMHICT